MDEVGCGWLHELLPTNKTTSGVVSSLVKKGLIVSEEDNDRGKTIAYWVEITEEGKNKLTPQQPLSNGF